MSKYLILLYDEESAWVDADAATTERLMTGHGEFGVKNADKVLGGNALQPVATATTVRGAGAAGFTVTDGPFAETKEALGGYYLVEAADLDEAIELAKQVPIAAATGGREVRPIMVFE
jgi:hypothetical protein